MNAERSAEKGKTMNIAKERVKREVIIWVQLFLVAFVLAVVVHAVYESVKSSRSVDSGFEGNADVAVNFRGMLWALWDEHYSWCFAIFAVLCAVRLITLFVHMRKDSTRTGRCLF